MGMRRGRNSQTHQAMQPRQTEGREQGGQNSRAERHGKSAQRLPVFIVPLVAQFSALLVEAL